MLGYQWVNGGEGLVLRVHLQDATTGQGLTGLDYESAGLIISTIADNVDTAVGYAGGNIETIGALGTFGPTTGKCGFREVDDTNQPGLYELQFVDSTWSTTDARYVHVCVSGVSGLRTFSTLMQLSSVPADLRRIDGVNNSAAELSLKRVSIENSEGAAVEVRGGYEAESAVSIAGNYNCAGLGISGDRASAVVIGSVGLVDPFDSPTIDIGGLGTQTAPVIRVTSAANNDAVVITGGTTSGNAVVLNTTDGDGLVINSAGSGKVDIAATIPDSAGVGTLLTRVSSDLSTDVSTVKSDVATIKSDVVTVKDDVSDILADTSSEGVLVASGAKTGYSLTNAYDLYHADILLTVDNILERDEYTVTWFKNGVRIASGIASTALQVVRRADGADLVDEGSIDEIGETGSFKHNEPSNRLVNGEAAIAIVSAEIDGSARTFSRIVGRDAA